MSRRFGTVRFISGMFVISCATIPGIHNEQCTDEEHSSKTSEDLLLFWHFNQHSTLVFILGACATQTTKLFSFLHNVCLTMPTEDNVGISNRRLFHHL